MDLVLSLKFTAKIKYKITFPAYVQVTSQYVKQMLTRTHSTEKALKPNL